MKQGTVRHIKIDTEIFSKLKNSKSREGEKLVTLSLVMRESDKNSMRRVSQMLGLTMSGYVRLLHRTVKMVYLKGDNNEHDNNSNNDDTGPVPEG